MKYGIIKTTFDDRTIKTRSIVGYTDSVDDFSHDLQKQYSNLEFHQNISFATLKTNNCFKNKEYLIHNGKTIFHINKTIEIDAGFWYNTKQTVINVMTRWELIQISNNDNTEQDLTDLFRPYSLAHQKLAFKEFNLSDVAIGSKILLIGKKESGKTTIVNNIIEQRISDDPALAHNMLIISNPSDLTSYKERYPNATVLDSYDSDQIRKFTTEKDIESQSYVSGIIVFDDCFVELNVNKDNTFMNLMYNGRQYGKTVITCVQTPVLFKPEIRANFDYVFMFGNDDKPYEVKLYNYYAGMFPSFEIFRDVFVELTKNYGAMVINNRSRDTDITSKIYYHKAQVE